MTEEITQAEYIRKRLEEQIVLGHLRPGQRVEELALAEKFETSRTPVREAVAQLISSGLLTKSTRQGTFVVKLSVEQTLELVEFSAELAAASACLAARRMSAGDLRQLRGINETLEDCVARADVSQYAVEASKFHSKIIQRSQNAFLIKALDRTIVQLAAYFRFQLTYPAAMRRDLDDHWSLLAAFERRDLELSRQLMHGHAQVSADMIRDYLAYLDAGADG